jgi:hypothetical protein
VETDDTLKEPLKGMIFLPFSTDK